MWHKNPVVMTVIVGVLLWVVFKYIVPRLEGFDNPNTKVNPKCPEGYKQCASGDCVPESDPHQTCSGDTNAY
jgi:hypothetical protein